MTSIDPSRGRGTLGKTITRQALYEAVWAQPITKLAAEFGISDVALAKACKKLGVSLPPRGYWARKAAGKPVVRIALPPRPPGVYEETTIGAGRRHFHYNYRSDLSEDEILGPIPPPPTFEEPIENVRARIEAMIGKAAIIHRNLEQPHPAVGKLLAKDANRRLAAAGRAYVLPWDEPLYDSPLQQRRLRLASSILMTAARCGCRAESFTHEDRSKPVEQFTVVVGDRHVRMLVSAVEPSSPRVRRKAPGRSLAPTLRVELDHDARIWEDVDAGNGSIIREIAVTLFLKAEQDLRSSALSNHAWRLRRRQEIFEDRRNHAEEAARKERERLAELDRNRVERLLGEAEELRKALAMRAYVQTVRLAAQSVSPSELDAWADWALDQADRRPGDLWNVPEGWPGLVTAVSP